MCSKMCRLPEHASHTTLPHERQWWRRRSMPNLRAHTWHALIAESDCHSGANRPLTGCAYADGAMLLRI
jgi:hypothetical protein